MERSKAHSRWVSQPTNGLEVIEGSEGRESLVESARTVTNIVLARSVCQGSTRMRRIPDPGTDPDREAPSVRKPDPGSRTQRIPPFDDAQGVPGNVEGRTTDPDGEVTRCPEMVEGWPLAGTLIKTLRSGLMG